jgi:hypothetical protein
VSDIRWVALHDDGTRAGSFTAPDRDAAERHAYRVHGPRVRVQSFLSWEESARHRAEEQRQRDRIALAREQREREKRAVKPYVKKRRAS